VALEALIRPLTSTEYGIPHSLAPFFQAYALDELEILLEKSYAIGLPVLSRIFQQHH
jgi:hypothetical protein